MCVSVSESIFLLSPKIRFCQLLTYIPIKTHLIKKHILIIFRLVILLFNLNMIFPTKNEEEKKKKKFLTFVGKTANQQFDLMALFVLN